MSRKLRVVLLSVIGLIGVAVLAAAALYFCRYQGLQGPPGSDCLESLGNRDRRRRPPGNRLLPRFARHARQCAYSPQGSGACVSEGGQDLVRPPGFVQRASEDRKNRARPRQDLHRKGSRRSVHFRDTRGCGRNAAGPGLADRLRLRCDVPLCGQTIRGRRPIRDQGLPPQCASSAANGRETLELHEGSFIHRTTCVRASSSR